MPYDFIVPQSPAGAVSALYYITPNMLPYHQQQPPPNPSPITAYRQCFGKSPTTPVSFLHPKFKTEMCNKYDPKYGCPYGEQCQFRHPEDPTPPEAVVAKISQMAISEGSNSVSSNNSVSVPMIGHEGRFLGRSHLGAVGDGRRVSQSKTIFRSQYNVRQVLKTKGNGPNSPSIRQSTKPFSAHEDTTKNGGSGGGVGGGGNKPFYRQFLGKSPSTPASYLHPKFKTEMCNKYNSKFGCPYGEQCQFRHPEDPPPSEAIVTRMSHIAISEGSNSVSSNNSFGTSLVSRGGRFVGRNHIGSSGDGRGFFQNRIVFRQYNGRQVLKTKENGTNSVVVRQSPKLLATSENRNSAGGTKQSYRQFFNEKTLPNFLKCVSKVSKSGMRRYNSHETIGLFTYAEVSKFKKIYH